MGLATDAGRAHAGGAENLKRERGKMNLAGSLIAAGLFTSIAFSALPLGIANAQDTGKKVISSPNAPNPIGPYSQAIQVGKTVYLAGQVAIDPKSNQPMVNASIEDQTRRTLDNLKAVLEADGMTMDHIVSTTVFLKDLNDFGKMNEVYATYFKDAPPARATVEAGALASRFEGRDFCNCRTPLKRTKGGNHEKCVESDYYCDGLDARGPSLRARSTNRPA